MFVMSEAKKETGVATPKPKPKMKMAAVSPNSSPPKHPAYLEMIVTVLHSKPESTNLRAKKGVAVRTLEQEIVEKYELNKERSHPHFKAAFNHGLDLKLLSKVKGIGLSGSVRFHRKFIEALKNYDDEEMGIYKFAEHYLKEADAEAASAPEKEKKPRKKAAVAKETNQTESSPPKKKRRAEKASADEPKEKKAK